MEGQRTTWTQPSTPLANLTDPASVIKSLRQAEEMEGGVMRALSILQPWAWLIVNGLKDIENRSWSTPVRGRFLVHAGKRWGREQRYDLEDIREQFPSLLIPDSFDLGGIVGAATIVDCVQHSSSPWFNGPNGFVLENGISCPFIPWKGQLGWFQVPRSALGTDGDRWNGRK